MTAEAKPRILCVDDEPAILDGLALHLRRRYQLEAANSGAAALEVLAREPDISVIISDMRMPGMDGASFLARAREVVPNAVRMLLTGESDLQSTIAAVNEGQIFRFLTKPCPPPALLAAVASAVEQHQLITAERVLLEQTVHGCIKTLTDVLALVSPTSFGRAVRIKRLVSDLLDSLCLHDRWQVEVAAMLSQLGYITLPPKTAENIYFGLALSVEEKAQATRLPAVTEELLGNIPRLEAVREILRTYPKSHGTIPAVKGDADRQIIDQGAQLLRIAVDFDALESADESSASLAVSTLQSRAGQYNPDMLRALASIRGAASGPAVQEVSARDLRVGMILAEDVKTKSGMLLAARGFEVTQRFLVHFRSFSADGMHNGMWRVIVPKRDAA